MDSSNQVEIRAVKPKIKFHSFTTTVSDNLVKFEVIQFKDSIFLWIGDRTNRTFKDLSLGLTSQFSDQAVSTKLMGDPTDLTSSNLSIKLTKKLGKPVYVSFNLVNDRLTVPVVNSRIVEEINENPQFF